MKYDHQKIEKKWTKRWLEERTYEPSFAKASEGKPDLDGATNSASSGTKPFYNLMMFPYPSAEGLHVGNMYAFTGSDIYGRYQRMLGNDVFEPIGLDGFGIHSENYAMKVGMHPMDQAKISEKRFYEQLQKIGNGFAWEERLQTYDPEYYRWTQWIFVQMWKHGLAYRKKQLVNWCPKDLTVLSDEQVEGGKCERCGTEVVKKDLEQWSFRITNYADRLLANLENLDWSEKVKIAQKNWIGKSEGAEITFLLDFKKNPADNERRGPNGERAALKVFTTRADTLFGATYLVLAPEHPWVRLATDGAHDVVENKDEVKAYVEATKKKKENERTEEKEKTGVELRGVTAINPANKEEIPIWIADYVLGSYGTGAIMAVPAHDERDFTFAKKFGLPIIGVIKPQEIHSDDPQDLHLPLEEKIKKISDGSDFYLGTGELMNSEKFDGMDSGMAKGEIVKFVGGERKTQFRLRDWLISRQRYWGPPIPMIFCDACAAAEKGEQKKMPGWYAVAETDLPVILPMVKDFRPTGSGVSPLAAEKSFYETKCPGCGGSARRETDVSDTFLDSAWYYLRYLNPEKTDAAFDTPRIKSWLPAEMYIGGAEHAVLHLLYVRFVAMALHDFGFINFEEPFKKFRAHGLVIKDGAKMSKSKGNVINPDEYVKNFGGDTLRMYLMFMAPFEDGGDFRDQAILGIARFLERVWKMAESRIQKSESRKDKKVLLHKTIKKVGEDIAVLHYNTAISTLMICLRELEEKGTSQEEFETFLKLLAPFAPFMTEEIWHETLKYETSIHRALWPEYDSSIIKEDTVTLILQVNSRTRGTVSASAHITEAAAIALARANEGVKLHLIGKEPKKIIYVPGKLVNIVI